MSTMIPYKEYDIEVYKAVFSFYQAKISKNGKEVWFSKDMEFVNWDQAAKHCIGLIDNGQI